MSEEAISTLQRHLRDQEHLNKRLKMQLQLVENTQITEYQHEQNTENLEKVRKEVAGKTPCYSLMVVMVVMLSLNVVVLGSLAVGVPLINRR